MALRLHACQDIVPPDSGLAYLRIEGPRLVAGTEHFDLVVVGPAIYRPFVMTRDALESLVTLARGKLDGMANWQDPVKVTG